MHFEIHADNVERAIKFYTQVFGWKIEKWAEGEIDYWFVMSAEQGSTEPGINGGLLKRPVPLSQQMCGANAFVCTMVVDNYDEMSAKILAEGGTVAMPKYALKGMAWQGYFLDTEGNTFGIHQADESAE